jgi:hypothetical protein
METTNNIANLRRRRNYQIGRFTTASKRLDAYEQCDEKDKSNLPTHMAWVEDAWKQYRSFQDQLEDLGEEANPRDPELESIYFNLTARISKVMANTPASTSTPPIRDSPNTAEPAATKLPEMHLPTFSGAYEDWPGFADQFRCTVHDNPRIDDCKRLTYLRSCLTHDAALAISSLSNAAANYSVAWEILEERYNRPAKIVERHLQGIFNIGSFSRTVHRDLQSYTTKLESHYKRTCSTFS